MPTPPYRASSPLAIPTPYSTTQSTHPSVLDFGTQGWNGSRFWMAHTPFPYGEEPKENPCIAISADRVNWSTPHGLTNPVYQWQGEGTYNTDTDLAYDPDTGKLWLYFRKVTTAGGNNETIIAMSSSNGTTWSTPQTLFTTSHLTRALSPSVLRIGPGDWRMWCIGASNQSHTVRTAPSPEGPWSSPTALSFQGLAPFGSTPWHADVNYDSATELLHMILNDTDGRLLAATSQDGITWTAKAIVMDREATSSRWDAMLYRATMTLEDTGQVYSLWYGGRQNSSGTWHIGFTRVPRSLWAG